MQMTYIKLIIILLLEKILKIFYVIPIKKNRIFFMAFSGNQYSCSPKYIFEYLKEKKIDQYEYIWAFNSPSKFSYLKSKDTKLVKNKSLIFCYYLLTSQVVIVNTISFSWIPLRSKQCIINTWHGGGCYKKSGPFMERVSPLGKFIIYRTSKKYNYFISSCSKFSELFLKGAFHYHGNILEIGLPRNDVFWKSNSDELANKVKNNLNINKENKVLLYAPTYRDDNKENIYIPKFSKVIEALKGRFGGEWTILYRNHYFSKKKEDSQKFPGIDVSSYPDMQELLIIADVLITDYSSSIWDFSFSGKPCFLYIPDIVAYKNIRNFFIPIEKWNLPLSINTDELVAAISNYDPYVYQQQLALHHIKFGSFENGNASFNITKLIQKVTSY